MDTHTVSFPLRRPLINVEKPYYQKTPMDIRVHRIPANARESYYHQRATLFNRVPFSIIIVIAIFL